MLAQFRLLLCQVLTWAHQVPILLWFWYGFKSQKIIGVELHQLCRINAIRFRW